MASVFNVTLTAPSTLDTRASCPTNFCEGYDALIEYCGNYYNADNSKDSVGADAISCMCYYVGAEGIGQWDGEPQDEGFLFVDQCYQCATGTGDAFTLLDRWELACSALENVDMQEALTCLNENNNCDPLISLGKRAKI